MAIQYAPYQDPNPAYRPIQWQFKATSANVVERCVPTVTINGTPYTLSPVPYISNVGTDYFFNVDVQTFVQNALAPKATSGTSSIFGGFNSPYAAMNADCFATISISVTYLYRDPSTNLLTDLGVTDTDGPVYALNSTPQHGQDLDYADYFPQFNNTDRKWLSVMPNNNFVALTDNAWLTFISDAGANQIRISTFQSNGTAIDVGLFSVSISAINEPQTIGVGPANLATQVYTSGSVNLSNSLVAYYTVELIGAAFPFLDPYLEVKRFDLETPCNDAVRLHWFGILAGAESYTFTAYKSQKTQAQSTTAQKPLEWQSSLPQNLITDKGAYKIYTDASELIEVKTDFLGEDEAQWLKTLLYSVEVYIETPNGLMPVIIETTELDDITFDGLTQFNLSIRYANNPITQNA